MTTITVIQLFLVGLGGISFLTTGVGVLRFPDFYTRIHAVGVADSLGFPCIILALMLQAGWSLIALKLLLLWIFMYITGPTATHAIAKAAYLSGLKPLGKDTINKE